MLFYDFLCVSTKQSTTSNLTRQGSFLTSTSKKYLLRGIILILRLYFLRRSKKGSYISRSLVIKSCTKTPTYQKKLQFFLFYLFFVHVYSFMLLPNSLAILHPLAILILIIKLYRFWLYF